MDIKNLNINNEIKVSVVIAVYNAEKYLEECLDSVVGQSLKDIEVICVNDGSTDSSLDILNCYKEKDSRLKVITQPNTGAGAARNRGMLVATGKYLSFLDADDFFEKTMLEEAYHHASSNDTDICVFASNVYEQDTGNTRPCTWAFQKEYFPVEEVFSPKDPSYCDNIFRMFNGWAWDKLFKTEFIKKNHIEFQNLRTTNDMFFVYYSLAKAEKIYAFDRVLANQRVNVSTSLSRTREKSWDCFYHALCLLRQELINDGIYELYKKAFINWTVNFSIWQYNTIHGEMKEKVYELLKYKAFAELDAAKYPREMFFSEKEYEKMVSIITRRFNN